MTSTCGDPTVAIRLLNKDGQTKKYKLSVASMFKNESMIMEEWLQYYINQGVEHFYLIDNGSTDDYNSILSRYRMYISLVKDDERYKTKTQEILINKYYLGQIKRNTDWITFIDCDEYIYAPKSKCLVSFLMDLDQNSKYDQITDVFAVWKIFGSNNLVKQPSSIINSFTKRMDLSTFQKMAADDRLGHGKSLCRTRNLERIGVHKSFFTVAKKTLNPDDSVNQVDNFFEKNLYVDNFIVCNHYIVMSKEYYDKCKSKRVAGSTNRKRNDSYWNQMNCNEKTDKHLIQYLEQNIPKKKLKS